MSALLPIIADWEKRGLFWRYIHELKTSPITIPPNRELRIPSVGQHYAYPEIVVCYCRATFDDPACGIRLWGEPNYDTKRAFTINNLIGYVARPEPLVYVSVPPEMPPGLFAINLVSPWNVERSLKLSVFNTDSTAHTCIKVEYLLAVLMNYAGIAEQDPRVVKHRDDP